MLVGPLLVGTIITYFCKGNVAADYLPPDYFIGETPRRKLSIHAGQTQALASRFPKHSFPRSPSVENLPGDLRTPPGLD